MKKAVLISYLKVKRSIVAASFLFILVNSNAIGQAPKPSLPNNEVAQKMIGFIYAFPGEEKNLPGLDNTWMICDHRSLNIADYLDLFKIIGWTYGYGNEVCLQKGSLKSRPLS